VTIIERLERAKNAAGASSDTRLAIVDKSDLAALLECVKAANEWRDGPTIMTDETVALNQALWDHWTKARKKVGLG